LPDHEQAININVQAEVFIHSVTHNGGDKVKSTSVHFSAQALYRIYSDTMVTGGEVQVDTCFNPLR